MIHCLCKKSTSHSKMSCRNPLQAVEADCKWITPIHSKHNCKNRSKEKDNRAFQWEFIEHYQFLQRAHQKLWTQICDVIWNSSCIAVSHEVKRRAQAMETKSQKHKLPPQYKTDKLHWWRWLGWPSICNHPTGRQAGSNATAPESGM